MAENDNGTSGWLDRLFGLLESFVPDLNTEQRKNWAKLLFALFFYGGILWFTVPLIERFDFWGRNTLIVGLILLGVWQVLLKSYAQCQQVFDRDIFRDES
jgi:hypothetical protein